MRLGRGWRGELPAHCMVRGKRKNEVEIGTGFQRMDGKASKGRLRRRNGGLRQSGGPAQASGGCHEHLDGCVSFLGLPR